MSQQMVGQVMERLLTDEELRLRFVYEPLETLADLHRQGFELTEGEIDLFMRSDARIWFRIERIPGVWLH